MQIEWDWGDYVEKQMVVITKSPLLITIVYGEQTVEVWPHEIDDLINALHGARDTIRREASRKEAEDVVERARRLV